MAASEPTELELLCPQCEYNLRGQITPRCPECGSAFTSLESLAAASRDSERALCRVMRWRLRIALGIIAGVMIAAFAGRFLRLRGIFWLIVQLGPLLLTSGFSCILLAQVVFWRLDRRLPLSRRRQLNGSIALLAIFAIPFVCLMWVFVA